MAEYKWSKRVNGNYKEKVVEDKLILHGQELSI